MRLLFASDLHGSELHYASLAALAAKLKPDAVLLGGDLFHNNQPVADAPLLQRQEAETVFAAWCGSLPAPVYWIGGNHEWAATLSPPPNAGACVHGRCVPLGDWDLIGFSLTSPTPYWLLDHERREEKREHRETRVKCYVSHEGAAQAVAPASWLARRPTLLAEMRALPEPRHWRRTLLMAHDPPFDTGLDVRYGHLPVGSADVRHFIMVKQPAISLHGHIHEAPFLSGRVHHMVGATHGFNAGRANHAVRALWLDPDRPAEHEVFEGGKRL